MKNEPGRILVVDDEFSVRDSLYNWFRKDGFAVRAVESAALGVERGRSAKVWNVPRRLGDRASEQADKQVELDSRALVELCGALFGSRAQVAESLGPLGPVRHPRQSSGLPSELELYRFAMSYALGGCSPATIRIAGHLCPGGIQCLTSGQSPSRQLIGR